MHMDGSATLLIMLKQGINGIFNAYCQPGVSFLLTEILEATSQLPDHFSPGDLFNLLVAVILAPALLIMLLTAGGRCGQCRTPPGQYSGAASIYRPAGIW